jgi:hypothetical protein
MRKITLMLIAMFAIAVIAGNNDDPVNRSWFGDLKQWFTGGYNVDNSYVLGERIIATADSNYALYAVPSGYNVLEATLNIGCDTIIASEYYVAVVDSGVASTDWLAFEADIDSMGAEIMRIPVIESGETLYVRGGDANLAFVLNGRLVRQDVAMQHVASLTIGTFNTFVYTPPTSSDYATMSYHYCNTDTAGTESAAIIEFKTKIGSVGTAQLFYRDSIPATSWIDASWGDANFQLHSMSYGDTVWVRSTTGSATIQAYGEIRR